MQGDRENMRGSVPGRTSRAKTQSVTNSCIVNITTWFNDSSNEERLQCRLSEAGTKKEKKSNLLGLRPPFMHFLYPRAWRPPLN